MGYKTGIHLLKLSGASCLQSLKGFVLYFFEDRHPLSKSDLVIFMYEANFSTEFGSTMEVI